MGSRSGSIGPGSWSGKTWAFILIMSLFLFMSLFPAIYPIKFAVVWNGSLNLILVIFSWLSQGWTGVIIPWAVAIVICLMVISAPILALEKLYYWVKGDTPSSRSQSTSDEYRVEDELE